MEETSSLLLNIAYIGFSLSVLLQIFTGSRKTLYLLLLSGFLLSLSAIHRDSYLHPWDERYHALVAKNMMETPLEPKLYKEKLIEEFNYQEWYKAHIWLHKQPVFLWQMAATMYIFGDGLVGMRLSSAIMLLLFSFAVYKASDIYFPKASFWVAFLASIQPYLLLLASGRYGMDHNDIAFITWVSVGFWGLMAQLKKPEKKWLALIGMAVGCAMLTKWLAGSFVLCIWGLHLFISKDFSRNSWLNLFTAGIIAALLFVPWQIYSYVNFPEMFIKEWNYNSLHLTEVIEKHKQPWFFHIHVWYLEFKLVSLGLLIGVALLIKTKFKSKLLLTLAVSIAAVIIFYSIAQTKLTSYTLFALPIVLFLFASALNNISNKWIIAVIGLTISYFGFKEFQTSYLYNTQNEQYAEHQKEIIRISEEIAAQYPENTVIFNVPPMEFVEFMFFSDRISYEFIPRKEQVAKLKEQGYQSVVLLPPNATIDSTLVDLVSVKYVSLSGISN